MVARTRDNLTSISDDDAFSFGVWGERRALTWDGFLEGEGFLPEGSARGYTDHEHLDGVGLIHMNGRVYDPVIGRFLSADPFIQAPEFSQSYNRYSYVFNNPLVKVDPSGYVSTDYVNIDYGRNGMGAAAGSLDYYKCPAGSICEETRVIARRNLEELARQQNAFTDARNSYYEFSYHAQGMIDAGGGVMISIDFLKPDLSSIKVAFGDSILPKQDGGKKYDGDMYRDVGMPGYLDLDLTQQMVGRSQAALSGVSVGAYALATKDFYKSVSGATLGRSVVAVDLVLEGVEMSNAIKNNDRDGIIDSGLDGIMILGPGLFGGAIGIGLAVGYGAIDNTIGWRGPQTPIMTDMFCSLLSGC